MSDKLQRTVARFQQRIDKKEFYEAHQTLRTITNRYVKSKNYDDAIDLLYQGSNILAKNNEFASASDLISYLIHVYEESGVVCLNDSSNKHYKSKLIELISSLPDTDPSLNELAKQALNWSVNFSETKSKFGDASLHHIFGVKLLNAASSQPTEDTKHLLFSVAELHLILGLYESLPIYVDFLYKWYQTTGGDPGVYISRAVINYGYLKNVHFANLALDQFLERLVAEGKQEYETFEQENNRKLLYFQSSPLLNLLQLVVVTLGKEQSGEKFLKLYNHYKSELASKELANQVGYLGNLFFGLNLGGSQGQNNLLANMMGSLFK